MDQQSFKYEKLELCEFYTNLLGMDQQSFRIWNDKIIWNLLENLLRMDQQSFKFEKSELCEFYTNMLGMDQHSFKYEKSELCEFYTNLLGIVKWKF